MTIKPTFLVWASIVLAAPFLSHGRSQTSSLPAANAAARIKAAANTVLDGRQLCILVIGASSCGPCLRQLNTTLPWQDAALTCMAIEWCENIY